MGSGRFDSDTYHTSSRLRSSRGINDFEYSQSATRVHPNLNPMRIKDKPFHMLESRDSDEHPNSNAVMICLDVTGSNIANARIAHAKLPNLMAMLERYLPDPQVAVGANDDFHAQGANGCTQISDFESDNRIDEHIRNIWLTGNGGGNDGESYDLLLYAAANKVIMDCYEKRGRKGYFFMYADEPMFSTTNPEHANAVFGDRMQTSIGLTQTVQRLKEKFHVFILWPLGGFDHARAQYVRVFGNESVFTLQQPALICEMVGSLIGMTEGRLNTVDEIRDDLVAVGASAADAVAVSNLLVGTGHRPIRIAP